MPVDKSALLDAVNDLIRDANPKVKVEAMDALFALTRRYPARLTDSLEVLNPLLDLRAEDPPAYEGVQRLIDSKRRAAGLPPCWPEPEPERFDKTEYQRQLMAQRRVRAGRALAIENYQRPERDRLMGNARLEFERRTLSSWGKRLDGILQKARVAEGGKLIRERQDEIRDAFWASVDAALDRAEQLVREGKSIPKDLI